MLKSKISLLSALLLLASAGVGWACFDNWGPGPLTQGRQDSLKQPADYSFAFEITRLRPPLADRLIAAEDEYSFSDFDEERRHQLALLIGLEPQQAAILKAAEQAKDAQEVLGITASLPAEVGLYAAAAKDYHQEHFEAAAKGFQAVLDLPEDQGRLRSVWAAYMLGHLDKQDAAAEAHFQLSRRLAEQGGSDPLGLAVASFGEEGRRHYHRAKAAESKDQAVFQQEIAKATALYIAQTAHGSRSGRDSLEVIVTLLSHDRPSMAAALDNGEIRAVITAFFLGGRDYAADPDQVATNEPSATDPAVWTPAFTKLDFLQAMAKRNDLDGGLKARLALVSYQMGKYDLAQDFAAKASGTLADWVQAKLASQRGDQAAAASFYDKALRQIPADQPDDHARQRLLGEAALSELGRNDFMQAMTLFFATDRYWQDTAYLAERVLTIDELTSFVANNTKSYYPGEAPKKAQALRDLLARRLFREGRYEEAQRYQTDSGIGDSLTAFGKAMAAGKSEAKPIDRAEALFQAASLLNASGMELSGSELEPDFNMEQGHLGGAKDLPGQMTDDGATAEEVHRLELSAILPHHRFHYRLQAADLALEAAKLVPERSQAYAAMLCFATRRMFSFAQHDDEDPEYDAAQARAQEIYHLYLAKGALGPWGVNFGRRCQEPDFAAAQQTDEKLAKIARHQQWLALRHRMCPWVWPGLGFLVVILGGVGWRLRARKQR